MVYNIHAGHSLKVRGASSVLDEVTENRKVKELVIAYLKQLGHTVYDCTDDIGTTKNQNLANIVAKCNAHTVDVDLSIHLNAGRNDLVGDDSTGGVEVWGYNDGLKAIGSALCEEVASALEIRNRGFKTNTGYYVLKNTKNKALIIECCFVDDVDDAEVWNAELCARAIVKALTGQTIELTNNNPQKVETDDKVELKHSIGEYVTVSSYYLASTHPISEAKYGTKSGTIIKTYAGRNNPYAVGVGSTVHFFCNDGDIRSVGEPEKKPLTNYYPKYTGSSNSLVDALKSMGIKSDYDSRASIARANGISDFKGLAWQNTKILTLLKQGMLIKP